MVQKQTTKKQAHPAHPRLEWDDLRVALAIARAGTLRGAARSLGVSHSTVLRRLSELEARVGARLFERAQDRYEPTSAGQDVFDTAAELEEVVVALERRIEGLDLRLSGPVRVTLPDALLPSLLPVFKRFGEAYPEIDITLSTGAAYLDLAQREADLALRIATEPPPDLVGRRVAYVACGVYGSSDYAAARSSTQAAGTRRNLARLDWVGWPTSYTTAFAGWMLEHVPKARVALRVETMWAACEAVAAGLGVALLPCVVGDARPEWTRLRLCPEIGAPLWILTHRDLRTTAKVRALRAALSEAVESERALYEGQSRQ